MLFAATRPVRSDLALARRALGGESAAIDELLDRLRRFVPTHLARCHAQLGLGLDEHELHDLSQDVLIRVWTGLEHFRGAARLESWVARVAVNQLRNAARTKRRRLARVATVDLAKWKEPLPAPQRPTDLPQLGKALRMLPERDRELLQLRYDQGVSFQELAARWDVPLANVRSRYYRTLHKLRALLGPVAPSPEISGRRGRNVPR